jgi:uncharacterized membrane protein
MGNGVYIGKISHFEERFMAKYSSDMTLKEVMADPIMMEVIRKYLPIVDSQPAMVAMVEGLTVQELRERIPMPDIQVAIDKILEEVTVL